MTRLVAAGLSYRTAPIEVREQAMVAMSDGAQLLRYMVGHGGLSGAAVLSTCNRTEFYVTCPDDEIAEQVVTRLGRYLDPRGSTGVSGHISASRDAEAIRHIFRVASGLESMVVGESQVLGQFKAAHQLALQAGTLDDQLGYVMRRAISAGKRVRSDTSIGRGLGSLSEAAVLWALRRLGDLQGKGVLLVGAGKMSALAARRLRSLGADLYLTSREGHSATSLAADLGGTAIAGDRIDDAADATDLIVCSTDSPGTVLEVDDVERFQGRRGWRPLCILDIAVPRDVGTGVAGVRGVELVDLDGVGAYVEAGLEGRRGSIPEAQAIIEREVAHTVAALGQRDDAGPTIAALTQQAEMLRRSEVAQSLDRLPALDEETRDQVDRLTQSLVKKLLHAPISHLRENAGDLGTVLTLRDAFALDGSTARRGRSRPRSEDGAAE